MTDSLGRPVTWLRRLLLLAVLLGTACQGSTAGNPHDDVPPLAGQPGALPMPLAPLPGTPVAGAAPGQPVPAQPIPAAPTIPPPPAQPEPPAVAQPPAADGTAGAPAPPAEEVWQPFIEGQWELAPGTEGYRCVRQTVQEDIYISGLQALSPPGTHHTVLGIGPPSGPDGTTQCSAAELGVKMLFGSGVGTDTYQLPQGVALRLRAGEQLLLNLHLFNATQQPLLGASGTLIQTLAADEVMQVADNVLAGTMALNIPPGRVTQSGRCTMRHDLTLISVFPHMHQLGVHLRATAHSSTQGDVVLHDAAYDFDVQTIFPIQEVQMRAGDAVSIDCSYDNDTDRVVRFGDSSLAEMCFLGLFRYPAADDASFFICTN